MSMASREILENEWEFRLFWYHSEYCIVLVLLDLCWQFQIISRFSVGGVKEKVRER